MLLFPEFEIPDFQRLSKKPSWDPRKYQPIVYDEKISKYAETLKPGSLAYDDFWDEMDYYCYKGFKPKGMPRITGRHFYYLNMTKIDAMPKGGKKKRLLSPFYRDLDHWLFLELEQAQGGIDGTGKGYGLLITKPRRVGLSEFGAVNCNYELTFYSRNKIGICAGKDDKAQEFYDKLKSSMANVHPAYRNGKIKNNPDLIKIGYENTINKQKTECGLQSLARVKTMYADSGAFEGGSYSMVIFEEAGLFENLTKSYKATEPCFKDGHNQFGTPLVYGTGGEIDKGAKGFKEMWEKYEAYNIKPLFVPSYFYYPGDGMPDKKTKKVISFFNHKTGVTDRKLAKKYIEEDRIRASKSKDTYTKHVQSYPLHPKEVFLKTKGGLLDTVKLNFQMKKINAGEAPEPVLQGRLEWIDTPDIQPLLARAKSLKEKTKIRVANDIKVKFVVDEDGPVWKDASPINPSVNHLGYKPDIGACDSYDEEVDENSSAVSSGCVMAYRCFSGPSREYNKPVGLLFQRGDGSYDDDEFYENSVKFAIYWDLEILFEYTKFHILRYFYDVGAHNWVRGRPNIEEAGTTNHKNKDGVKMTTQVKPVLIRLLKQEIKENIHKCFFMNIILDLLDFGEKNTDIAMTYGIILLHRLDLFPEISEGIEIGNYNGAGDQGFFKENYYVDSSGNLRVNSFGEEEHFKLQTFIPERDLNSREYQEYMDKKQAPMKEIKREQEEYEKQAKALGVDPSILNLVLKEKSNYENR